VTLLEVAGGAHDLVDAEEMHVAASTRLVPRWVVRAGEVVELAPPYAAPSSSSA
jgi:hypothetical protein